jgi:hypothetical protein
MCKEGEDVWWGIGHYTQMVWRNTQAFSDVEMRLRGQAAGDS